MALNTIKGQERAVKMVTKALLLKRLASSYIFYGPAGVGKEMLAFEVAKALNCLQETENGSTIAEGCDVCNSCKKINQLRHPDVHYYFPVPAALKPQDLQDIYKEKGENSHHIIDFKQNTSISINTIRTIQGEASFKRFEGAYRVFIIKDVERMSVPAANALLKILEEPPNNMVIILLTSEFQALLPTILSRCQKIRFNELQEEVVGQIIQEHYQAAPVTARIISRISTGSIKNAVELLEDDVEETRTMMLQLIAQHGATNNLAVFEIVENLSRRNDKKSIVKLLKMMQGWFRDVLMIKTNQRENLINLDLAEKLEKYKHNFSIKDIIAITYEIEDTQKLLTRNVNVFLLLFNLIQKIRNVYQ